MVPRWLIAPSLLVPARWHLRWSIRAETVAAL